MFSRRDPRRCAPCWSRKQLQHKLIDIELRIRGILRGFGLKIGKVTKKDFEKCIRELVAVHVTLGQIAEAVLSARATLLTQFNKLHKVVLDIVRHDEVCRRLMTTQSVGAIVAITYRSALDDPRRITKSKNAGPLFGLTPSRYQSVGGVTGQLPQGRRNRAGEGDRRPGPGEAHRSPAVD
jgi:transposase